LGVVVCVMGMNYASKLKSPGIIDFVENTIKMLSGYLIAI